VPDEEVERLAKKHGPGSVAAEVWAELSAQRAKDRQVFAFRCGAYWITGPVPDIHAEADLVVWAEEDDEEEKRLAFVVARQRSQQHPRVRP
jgi:hypothetical protein